jgi:NADH-quinone oxidoreductase subunit L
MVFLTLFGPPQPLVQEHSPMARTGIRLALPLVVLAILAVVGGFVEVPAVLGGRPFLSTFLGTALPALPSTRAGSGVELALLLVAAVVSLGGVGLAYLLFVPWRRAVERQAGSGVGAAVRRFWFAGWGFDWLGDGVAWAYSWLARINRADVVDRLYQGIAWLMRSLHRLLSRTQNGRLRWYALGIGIGAVLVIAMVVLL